jgi:high-affinity iron transporter
MDYSTALPTFAIALREGVEAALVVGIVLALLEKAKQTRLNAWVYAGVVAGIVLSAIIGVLLNWITRALSAANSTYAQVTQLTIEAVFSLIAIAMLSWMLLWMTKQARLMKAQVEGAIAEAITTESRAGWGVFTLILIAVLREGFETVLFIASNFQQGLIPVFGAIAGLIAAAGIGILLFKWGVKINIRQFFQVMGIFLVLIVAGLVTSSLYKFDKVFAYLALINPGENLCFYYDSFTEIHSCILGPMVWDASGILPEKQFPGIVLKALFGYREHFYLVQAIAYLTFLFSIGGIYLRSISGSPAKTALQKS